MRRTRQEAEVTRQKLLTAGLEVFGRKGYSATRVEDIAREAGVTTGAIYHHFGGKSDLYIALVEQSSRRANHLAQQMVEEGGTPATILRRLLIRMFHLGEDDDDYRAVIELSVKTEQIPELTTINEQILGSRRVLVRFFSNLVEEGIRAGEIRKSISPEAAGLAVVGFLNGIGLIWIQDQDYFSIKKQAENLVDLFLSGMIGS